MTPATYAHLYASATSPDVHTISIARDDLAELMDAATKALGVMRALGWHSAMAGGAGSEDEAGEERMNNPRDDALIWLLEMAMTDNTMHLENRQEARGFVAAVKADIAARAAKEERDAVEATR
jgi:hypothetical protein